jgi:2,4-diketo-3-deoxy-L-fuconate hydrolase
MWTRVNSWSLTSCRTAAGGHVVGALTADGAVRSVAPLTGFADLAEVVQQWSDASELLADWNPDQADVLADVWLDTPLRAPGKLVMTGANYRGHLREMGIDSIPEGLDPYFFLLPSTALTGPDCPIPIPADPGARVDWEAELVAVIGRPGHRVPVADALDLVAGYMIVNDVSARGWHARPAPLAAPFTYDWIASKGRDGFCPVGPGLTPAWLVPDPQNLRVRLWRNGNLEQDASTADMIATVAQLVSAASHLMTLNPGDLLATGTPAGVGAPRGLALSPGDDIAIEIELLGRLENSVCADTDIQALGSLSAPR